MSKALRSEVLRNKTEFPKFNPIIEEFKFDYGPKGLIKVVPNGKIDVQKEVQSHANECGLVNIIKLAVAHGIDPASAPFAKKEKGIDTTLFPESYDELFKALEKGKQAKDKVDNLAKALGKTSDEILAAAQEGKLNGMIEEYVKTLQPKEEKPKDGDK